MPGSYEMGLFALPQVTEDKFQSPLWYKSNGCLVTCRIYTGLHSYKETFIWAVPPCFQSCACPWEGCDRVPQGSKQAGCSGLGIMSGRATHFWCFPLWHGCRASAMSAISAAVHPSDSFLEKVSIFSLLLATQLHVNSHPPQEVSNNWCWFPGAIQISLAANLSPLSPKWPEETHIAWGDPSCLRRHCSSPVWETGFHHRGPD